MAGKERGPFRPLGLRMQDFGRRLMRHYVSPQTSPVPQNFAPAPGWQADAQTPLIWGEPEVDTPPVEEWSADIPPVAEPPLPDASPPARRRPRPPAPTPTVQRKADTEEKIDPRLLAILAAHQEREAYAAQVREQRHAAADSSGDIQRQVSETGQPDVPPKPAPRRRNRASFDYVETKALLPPDDEMGRAAPPKTPPGNVIQPARESNQPDDDDSEESSQAESVDFDASQPLDQASPADVYIPAAPPSFIQRTAEGTSGPDDVPPEELSQFPDDDPETEPVYPQVYGLPEFPRVAEEPELFGEREITPPPSNPEKPGAPVSPSASSASSLQREADIASPQYPVDSSDAEPRFSQPIANSFETSAPPSTVQREIDPAPPPTRVPRKEQSPTKPPVSSPVNQPAYEQPPPIQRQNAAPEMADPTADVPVWQDDAAGTEWPPSTSELNEEGMEPAIESGETFSAAQPSIQREMDSFAEASAEADIESGEALSAAQPSTQREMDSFAEVNEGHGSGSEAYEDSAPPVLNQADAPQAPSERPVIQRKTQPPLDISPAQSDMGQGGEAASDMYFDATDYDQYTDSEPVESAFVQREYEDVQPTIDEGYWSESEVEGVADEFAAPPEARPIDKMPPVAAETPSSDRPVIQRKAQSPSDISPVQQDRAQNDESADTPFEYSPYSENIDASSVESGVVQREYEDVQPTIDEGYWSESEAEGVADEFVSPSRAHHVDSMPPVAAEPPPSSDSPTIQRKTETPSSTSSVQPNWEQTDESANFAFDNLIADSIPVQYADAQGQVETPFADEWENVGDEQQPFESVTDNRPDAPQSHFTSSPPNQIVRQPNFSQDIEQPEPFYDAPSQEAEQPVDVFQALVGAGMISPSDHVPRIDRQALPPEEDNYVPDEDTFSEEPYSTDQPVDLYQAMLNSGMVPPPAGRIISGQQSDVAARKAEPEPAPDPRSTTPERMPVQYAAEAPRVMRVETNTADTSESPSTEEKSGDVDIDKLARDVYSALRSRLRIEKERRG